MLFQSRNWISSKIQYNNDENARKIFRFFSGNKFLFLSWTEGNQHFFHIEHRRGVKQKKKKQKSEAVEEKNRKILSISIMSSLLCMKSWNILCETKSENPHSMLLKIQSSSHSSRQIRYSPNGNIKKFRGNVSRMESKKNISVE